MIALADICLIYGAALVLFGIGGLAYHAYVRPAGGGA